MLGFGIAVIGVATITKARIQMEIFIIIIYFIFPLFFPLLSQITRFWVQALSCPCSDSILKLTLEP